MRDCDFDKELGKVSVEINTYIELLHSLLKLIKQLSLSLSLNYIDPILCHS